MKDKVSPVHVVSNSMLVNVVKGKVHFSFRPVDVIKNLKKLYISLFLLKYHKVLMFVSFSSTTVDVSLLLFNVKKDKARLEPIGIEGLVIT